MQAAELINQRQAVDGNEFAVRKTFLQAPQGDVVGGIIVSRDEYRAINDQKICIGCGQTLSVFVVSCARPRQGHEPV